jgi:protein involved in polysaccharide export with SLBB domain
MNRMLLVAIAIGGLWSAHAAEPSTLIQPVADDRPAQNQGISADSYQLAAGDKLAFRVEEDPSRLREPAELVVPQVGDLEFPVSRDDRSTTVPLSVVGKTLAQVKAELKKVLEQDYYQKATVKLAVFDPNQRRGKVYFWGAVRGTVDLDPTGTMTVSEAILRLGWDQVFANLKRVEVTRQDPVTKQKKTFTVNVQQILDKNGNAKDLILQDGDRVHVPDKGIILN